MKVLVENSYSDGHESQRIVEVEEPAAAEMDEDWWEEAVFEHTGDGHYVQVYESTGERLGSCYTATVVEACDPALVGRTHEWID